MWNDSVQSNQNNSSVASASGFDLPIGAALNKTSLCFSIAAAITQKSFKIFTVKQEKQAVIKLIAQRQGQGDFKENAIRKNLIYWVLKGITRDREKYRKYKADI